MGDVVTLRVVETEAKEGNPEIVAYLAYLLRQAQAGLVCGVAIASLKRTEQSGLSSSTAYVACDGLDVEALLGALTVLQHRLVLQAMGSANAAEDAPDLD